LLKKLATLSKSKSKTVKALKLGKDPDADIASLKELLTAPTMPAVERYAGTLYDALGFQTLSPEGQERAKEKLFIQSGLFGLLPATEQIPYYRLSANSSLPGIDLKKHWTNAHVAVWPRMLGPILDLRSKSYAALNPIPDREHYTVEVLDETSGKALNHFNKKSKGAFVRAALENGLETVDQIPQIAKLAGLSARQSGSVIELIVPTGF
jgi:cytoplasmic iron level regulating protein YaaA (DUF328/UPF0246 family)